MHYILSYLPNLFQESLSEHKKTFKILVSLVPNDLV